MIEPMGGGGGGRRPVLGGGSRYQLPGCTTLPDTSCPCEATCRKMENVHYPGPAVQVRLVDAALVGGCYTRLDPEHQKKNPDLHS